MPRDLAERCTGMPVFQGILETQEMDWVRAYVGKNP